MIFLRFFLMFFWGLAWGSCCLWGTAANAEESFPPLVPEGEQLAGDLTQPENLAALLEQISGHTSSVLSVAFSPDGTTLASGEGNTFNFVGSKGKGILEDSDDNSVRLWDMRSGREIKKLSGHRGPVSSVAFSSDGKTLASGSYDNSVGLWDVNSGHEIQKLNGHSGSVLSVAFSSDGKTLASGSLDGSVRLWDVRDGHEMQKLGGRSGHIPSAAFSPDGLGDRSGHISSVAFSPDGLGDRSGHISSVAVDPDGLDSLSGRSGRSGHISSVAFSPDGKTLAYGSLDGGVRLWDVRNGRKIQKFSGNNEWAMSVTFSPDGEVLAFGTRTWEDGGYDDSVRLWDVNSGREIQELSGHIGLVLSVAFSPDGKTLASGSLDGSLQLWEISGGRETQKLSSHTGWVSSVAFSPDGGKTLASGGGGIFGETDNNMRLWDVSDGREIQKFSGYTSWVSSVAFSPDGNILASGEGTMWIRLASVKWKLLSTLAILGILKSNDSSVRLWDVRNGRKIQEFSDRHAGWVSSVAFSPDGETLASGGGSLEGRNSLRLWGVSSGHEIQKLSLPHTQPVFSTAFSPDGKTLASSRSDDNSVRLWEMGSGREIQKLSGHTGAVFSTAFSPDGKILASGASDNNVRLWEVSNGREIQKLSGHTRSVLSVAFSPDGKTLASGSDDNSVRLWEVDGGRETGKLSGDTSWVSSGAFSPDGKTLASGSYDNSVRLWEVGGGKLAGIYFGDTRGLWLSCQTNGQCLRYDDGRLLAQRTETGLVSVPPPAPATPGELMVMAYPESLLLAEGGAESFTLKLRNRGQGRLYWMSVRQDIVRDAKNTSPLVLLPPATIGVLEPGAKVELTMSVSALAGYENPHSGIYPLNLHISHAHDEKGSLAIQIPVQVHTPDLKVLETRMEGDSSLSVTLRNHGKQALPQSVFSARLDDFELDTVIREKTVAPQEELKISFALPAAALPLDKKSRLHLSVRKTVHPIHKWDLSNLKITQPPSRYFYILMSSVVLATLILVYYGRLFRHPQVVSVSRSPETLADLPLDQLKEMEWRLRRTGRWNTVISGARLPLSRWRAARDFYQSQDAESRCRILAERLGATPLSQTEEAKKNWLFVLKLDEDFFLLNISLCLIAFPPAGLSDEKLLNALRVVQGEAGHVGILIATDPEQQARLRVLRQNMAQETMMQVVPDNRALTRLLLADPGQAAGLAFAQIIAEQVKVTRISPYQSSGGVKKAGMFFGRTRLLADILQREPRNYLLTGARQSGKTSLLRELERRSQTQTFYLSLSRNDLMRSLPRLAPKLGLPADADPEELLAALGNPPPGVRYMLLLDEADNFIRAQADEAYPLLHTLRNLSEEGRCQFILAGFWDLYAAVSLDYQSPLKNFGESLSIGALEPDACRALAVEPMKALGIRYADPALADRLIAQSGGRANLISIICDVLVYELDGRRVIEEKDVERAMDSQTIRNALGSWGNLTGDAEKNRLDRIVVYATVSQETFTMADLWLHLEPLKIPAQPERVQESLARLELAFILEREKERYRYRVPLLSQLLLAQGPAECLKRETVK
ncbi:MAG: AAA family ATPase [Gammaproteobacteria bacterium]|nr:AAA family ATPase [Gammaproteobacteria bacterium]